MHRINPFDHVDIFIWNKSRLEVRGNVIINVLNNVRRNSISIGVHTNIANSIGRRSFTFKQLEDAYSVVSDL